MTLVGIGISFSWAWGWHDTDSPYEYTSVFMVGPLVFMFVEDSL
jgi:hypothetical protein